MTVYTQSSQTLATITDVKEVYPYYYLASASIDPAAAPHNNANPEISPDTTHNPGSRSVTVTYNGNSYVWTDVEPSLTINNNTIADVVGQLYVVECTIFSNNSYNWGPLMTSSTYAAAKVAYNNAIAAKAATDLLGGHFIYKGETTYKYKKAEGDYDSTETYYIRSGDGTAGDPYVYSIVENPVSEDMDDYYVYVVSTPAGAGVIQTINDDPAEWGYNTWIGSNGIKIRKNEIDLSKWTNDGVEFFNNGISIAKYGNDIRLGNENNTKVLITNGSQSGLYTSAGMYIIKKMNDVDTVLAQFLANGAQIGQSGSAHSIIDANGQRFYGGSNGGTLLANIGYGEGVSEGGIEKNAPYYTFGIREYNASAYDANSAYNVGDLCIYGGGMYVCTTAITTHEAWNSNHWQFAVGNYSHAEGGYTIASGADSHAEGFDTIAIGHYSHVEGYNTMASDDCAHAEGGDTVASGYFSHAEGVESIASGDYSHAQNEGTYAGSASQTAIGAYNKIDTDGKYLFIIGNGTADNARSNALTVDWAGNIQTQGLLRRKGDVSFDDSTIPTAQEGQLSKYIAIFNDSNNKEIAYLRALKLQTDTPFGAANEGAVGAQLMARRTIGNTDKFCTFGTIVRTDGTPHYIFSSAANFRSDLGLGSVATYDTVPISHGGTNATTASAARTNLGITLGNLNACGKITVQTKEISVGSIEANGYKSGTTSFTYTDSNSHTYTGQGVIGWITGGTGASFIIPYGLYYHKTEKKIYWYVRNFNATARTEITLSVLVLFTY